MSTPSRTPLIALDLWRAQRAGRPGLERRRRRRLDSLVAHARTASPFYRHLYRGLPNGEVTLGDLPPVAKPELMAAFDDWVTDARVTRADVEAFTADPARVGVPYRGGSFVCTSSGTTGHPGLFVHDRRAVAVYQAEVAVRCYLAWLGREQWLGLARHGVREAAVVGTGTHVAGAGWYERGRRGSRLAARTLQVFSVQQPLDDLVAALNQFQPTVLGGYPSALDQLADEHDAGRLRIRPVLAATAGESLESPVRSHIAAAFGAPVRDAYAASEGLYFGFDCAHEWVHLSSDWSILEPVDDAFRPTPPGQASHTTLLTNLANHLQPVIRYDLGDSVLARPDPCPCGNPLPAVRVAGRSDDAMHLRTASGREITVLPLAIGVAMEPTHHVRRAQIVQTGPSTIRLRLDPDPAFDAEAIWRDLVANVRAFLIAQDLGDVAVVRADEPPQLSGRGGKFRRVVVEAPRPPTPSPTSRNGGSSLG